MKPLYLSSPVRKGLGSCLRPGGAALTERILDLLKPEPACTVLDAGCGTGASMVMLKERGITKVFGLDLDSDLLRQAHHQKQVVARGDLACLPVADKIFDMILCECVWNLTDKEKVLGEFMRILKPGGILAMTDIYSRATNTSHAGSWPVRCCFSAATDLDTVARQVSSAGFTIAIMEDQTGLLKKTAAEFIFVHGSLKDFWRAVTGSAELAEKACEASATSRPGLFLLVAKRNTL